MTVFADAAIAVWLTASCFLAVYGLHRAALLFVWFRHRDRRLGRPDPLDDARCPPVLVQLPLYNEAAVAERAIAALSALDWPRDLLRIQVLDDSDDETRAIVDATAAEQRARGVRIDVVRRPHRIGWKAGALAAGLQHDAAPFVAVFDADFVPDRDFLRRMLPPLLADPGAGLAQARWDHLDRDRNLLTRAQAVLLDAHFVLEHGARFRGGRFFNFNGTAGVFRRRAIDEAGGWSADTLVEDLDLSYRAQLAGWRFLYVDGVAAPAELPGSARAFRSQQRRWTLGSVQAARKLLPRLLRSELPVLVKVEAAFHLGANLAWLSTAALLLTMPIAAALRLDPRYAFTARWDLVVLSVLTANVAVFYGVAQRAIGTERLGRRLLGILPAFAAGAALTINNVRALCDGLRGSDERFVRTPKDGGRTARYRLPPDRQAAIEVLAGLAYAVAATRIAMDGGVLAAAFLALFALGLLGLGGLAATESFKARGVGAAEAAAREAPTSRGAPRAAVRRRDAPSSATSTTAAEA